MAKTEPSDIAPEVVAALEAILLVAVEPVNVKLLAQVLEQPTSVVEVLCNRLATSYDEAGHGFQLVKVAGGFRLQTRPELSSYVERFVLDGQQSRVSSAALETLAIIAYKQPISRLQIASIRGVDPDAVMRTLHGRGYITAVGRDDGPGQAVMWGTTDLFLEKLGLPSISDLPPIASFVPDASIVEALEKTLRIDATIDETDEGAGSPGVNPGSEGSPGD